MFITVEPLVRGHPWDQQKCQFKSGVRLWEVVAKENMSNQRITLNKLGI